jgi:hypothetical protein
MMSTTIPDSNSINHILSQCLSQNKSDRASGESAVSLLTLQHPDHYALSLIQTLCSTHPDDIRLLSASQFNQITYTGLSVETRDAIKVFYFNLWKAILLTSLSVEFPVRLRSSYTHVISRISSFDDWPHLLPSLIQALSGPAHTIHVFIHCR